MADRWDLMTMRKGRDGKTYYTKVGVMFARDKGGFSLSFEALPIGAREDGTIGVMAFPPRDRDDRPPAAERTTRGGGLDDDIPF